MGVRALAFTASGKQEDVEKVYLEDLNPHG